MGAPSQLEDIQERLDDDNHRRWSWDQFARSPTIYVDSPSQPDAKMVDSPLRQYFRSELDEASLKEVLQTHPDILGWPRYLIKWFAKKALIQHHGDETFRCFDNGLQMIDGLFAVLQPVETARSAEDIAKIRGSLASLCGDGDQYLLNVHAWQRGLRDLLDWQSTAIRDVRQFRAVLSLTRPEDLRKLDLDPIVSELEGLGTTLEVMAARHEEVEARVGAIARNIRTFVEKDFLFQNVERPRQSELTEQKLTELQQTLVSKNYPGHYRVYGSSGSGKTSILVHRALRLSKRDAVRTVQVVTNQTGLARIVRALVCELGGEMPHNLKVYSLQDAIRTSLSELDGGWINGWRHIDDDYDQRSGQKTAWLRFFGNRSRDSKDMEARGELFGNDSIAAPDKKRRPIPIFFREKYPELGPVEVARKMREEFDSILDSITTEAFPTSPEHIAGLIDLPNSYRDTLVRPLRAYEAWLEENRYFTRASLCRRFLRHVKKIDQTTYERKACCDHLLVDEAQQLSSMEMRALKQLCRDPSGPNAVFLTGDNRQRTSKTKWFGDGAGFDFRGRSQALPANHRNTNEILDAAKALVEPFLHGKPFDPDQDCEPIASGIHGERPAILEVNSERATVELASFVLEHAASDSSIGILSRKKSLLEGIFAVFVAKGIKCWWVVPDQEESHDRDQEIEDFAKHRVTLCHTSICAGMEFDTVLLLDMSASTWEESARIDKRKAQTLIARTESDAEFESQLAREAYTAMTRARHQLILTAPRRDRSRLLAPLEDQSLGSSVPYVHRGDLAKTIRALRA